MSMLHKAIKGFEDYLVSDTGQVYSLKSQKYLKARYCKNGYLGVILYKNGTQNERKIHRLVAEAFIPNPESKPTVDHINRVRDDNRLENLRWADYSEQRENSNNVQVLKENLGTPIIEIINDEVSVSYLSLGEVPNIHHSSIAWRVNNGETDFYVKQRNGAVRHFKLPK